LSWKEKRQINQKAQSKKRNSENAQSNNGKQEKTREETLMKRRIALITVLLLLVPFLVQAQVISTVERNYKWYAEEKLTISSSVIQLSSEEYGTIYDWTRISMKDANSISWTTNEVVTDGTTGAMGYVRASASTYLDIEIFYNGLDSADWDANDRVRGTTSGAGATVTGSYTRGVHPTRSGLNQTVDPQIAEIYVLDNPIIWTRNRCTPVYSATDSACVGRKAYEGDTFYIFGSENIINFKATRAGSSNAIIHIRYGM
jgi:hypothetical protein